MIEQSPTFNQITEQDTNGNDPTVLLRQKNGSIKTARLTSERHEDDWLAISDRGYERAPREALTDLAQAALATELADTRMFAEELKTGEVEKNPRLVALFQPLLRPEEEPIDEGPFSWDDILSGNVTDEQYAQALKDMTARPALTEATEYDNFVTDRSKLDARLLLDKVLMDDDGLLAIIDAHMRGEPLKDVVDALREDEALRYDAGVYLLDKLKRTLYSRHYYPDRISNRNHKTPQSRNFLPIKDLTSVEYSAYLALAMIDGSYNKEYNPSDSVVKNTDGRVTLGQHRTAARKLLEYDSHQKTAINFG